MIHRLEIYLDQVLAYAKLPPTDAAKVGNELMDHLLERISDFEKQGATRDDAVFRAIYDHGRPCDVGYGLRPRFPWIDVRLRGTARGVFAVGPRAVGVFACGLASTGVVSCGVVSVGIFSFGVMVLGLILGMGSVSVGLVSLGLNAVGLIAAGLNSAGVLSAGLNTAGIWVFHGLNQVSYFDGQSVPKWLEELGFVFGWNASEMAAVFMPLLTFLFAMVAVSIGLVWCEYRRLSNFNHWAFQ